MSNTFFRLILVNKGRNDVASRLGKNISITDLFLILEFGKYVDRRIFEQMINHISLLREYKVVPKCENV